MPSLAPTHLAEQLPAVLREADAERNGFLARFLQAFESVFDGVRAEAALVPSLFAVDPTPSLRRRADAGERILYLDSATGLCVGDVLRIEDVLGRASAIPPRVEFVTVAELRGRPQRAELPLPLPAIAPTTVGLAAALRYDHVQAAPLRRVGRPAASAPLAGVGVPNAPGPRLQELTLPDPEALTAAAGDVVQIGRDSYEYAQVVSTHGSVLVVTPPLVGIPPLETPVALLEPPATTTPPPALEHAQRSGRELVVAAPVAAGARRVELDSLADLEEGDLLELRERDAGQTELVRIADLPAKDQTGLAIPTLTLRVEPPFRFDHPAGTDVAVVQPAGRATTLAAPLAQGVDALTLTDPGALAAAPGTALQIGTGATADYAHVVSTSADGLRLAPATAHAHLRDETVARLATRSGGTGFLAWLGAAVGLELRPDRGERWNRELVRLVAPLWRWRGTRRGVEELVAGYVRGEVGPRDLPGGLERRGVEVLDLANPMQLGLVSTLGYDTVLCGRPNFFRVDLSAERRSQRMHQPDGIEELVRATQAALQREQPAYAFYDIQLHASTMQLGLDAVNDVGARLGDTTLLWEQPLVVAGDEERRA